MIASRPTLVTVLLALLMAAACNAPPSHVTRLWPQGKQGTPVLGLSTEDGVLVLADASYAVGDVFDLQFPVGNSMVRDTAEVIRINDHVAVMRPMTARLAEGRFASTLPAPDETLYLALRDEEDEPVMTAVERWMDGAFGDFVESPGDPTETARTCAGVGLYVQRKDRWRLVGILSGVTAHRATDNPDSAGLGFIGLAELARILPDRIDYLSHTERVLRPDFEFGVPLQPGDIRHAIEASKASGSAASADDTAGKAGGGKAGGGKAGGGKAGGGKAGGGKAGGGKPGGGKPGGGKAGGGKPGGGKPGGGKAGAGAGKGGAAGGRTDVPAKEGAAQDKDEDTGPPTSPSKTGPRGP